MPVNLVTRVRNFTVQNKTFSASDHDVKDGCVTPGSHKLLRFDFLSYNAGTADLVVGSPAARPDLFVWSAGHGHYHLKDFNEFQIFTAGGALATTGYKQAFCAIDIERISPTATASPRFNDCNTNQGISAGWADVYSSYLACQFVVIDGLPNGDYTLQSTTNTRHVVGEDCYGDNTIWTGLRIAANAVTVIDPPYVPEDRIPFNRANVAAVQTGGRWKVAEGNHWMLDTGTSQSEAVRAVDIINHYGLAAMCFVGRPRCGDVSPMMYWLNDAGKAPSGKLAGEDCIGFDRSSLAVVEIGGRWKVVEGTHWLLDFGPGQGNAIAALHFIRKYKFDQICYVGRPDPAMVYFKTSGRSRALVTSIDPRRIDASIDPPRWWREQRRAISEVAPSIDFTEDHPSKADNPRQIGSIIVETEDKETSEIIEEGGIRGLAVECSTKIRLGMGASVVDIGIAHFGDPPKIAAYSREKLVAEATADDRQRQIENVRLVGAAIDSIRISSADGRSLLNYLHIQPATTGRKPSKPTKKKTKPAR